jgi:protein-S-isoprenylcysteine O-methyltransferase Ste14
VGSSPLILVFYSRAIPNEASYSLLGTLVRVVAAISLTIWCVLHLRVYDHYFGFRLPNVVRIPAIVSLTMGGGLVLWCGVILSRAGILEEFRYVRNPMSLGGTLLFMGLGLYVRSISILVFSCLLFLLFHIVAVYFEEPGLTKRFGDSFEYKRLVGRWIPRIRRSTG